MAHVFDAVLDDHRQLLGHGDHDLPSQHTPSLNQMAIKSMTIFPSTPSPLHTSSRNQDTNRVKRQGAQRDLLTARGADLQNIIPPSDLTKLNVMTILVFRRSCS